MATATSWATAIAGRWGFTFCGLCTGQPLTLNRLDIVMLLEKGHDDNRRLAEFYSFFLPP